MKAFALGWALLLGASPAYIEVEISDQGFRPESLEVDVGRTITWYNISRDTHSVTSRSPAGAPADFHSGPIRPGHSFEHTFTRPGVFTYHSEFDPSFRGTIIVRERP